MEYITDLRAPSYKLPAGSRWEGLAFHTDETGPDNTLEQALRTLAFQASAGNTSGGSYHFIVGRKPDGKWAAVRGVSASRASGSISGTRTNPPWNPGRYPELKQYLSAEAYRDPNARLMSVCITGQTRLLSQRLPSGLAQALAELVRDFEAGKLTPSTGDGSLGLGSWGAFLCGHYQWQTNRADPGPLVLPAILDILNPVPTPVPTPVPSVPASGFSDVPDGTTFADDIRWVAENRIMGGIGGGKFNPKGVTTREQLAAVIHRAIEYMREESET